MEERFKLNSLFIKKFVKPGMSVADIGCGTGIFTLQILNLNAKVIAIDVSKESLKATREYILKNQPDKLKNVTFIQIDVSRNKIPFADIAIAIGVTPYVENINSFYSNILPNVNMFYCHLLDSRHWANRVRYFLPILNVRNVLLTKHNFALINRENFATGYFDIIKK